MSFRKETSNNKLINQASLLLPIIRRHKYSPSDLTHSDKVSHQRPTVSYTPDSKKGESRQVLNRLLNPPSQKDDIILMIRK